MIEVNKQKVITTDYTVYMAEDGQEFLSKEECERYETSAFGVVWFKLLECVIGDTSMDWAEMSEENTYKTLIPKEQYHIDALNQIWKMCSGRTRDCLMFDEGDIGKPIIIGYRLEADGSLDWAWFYKFVDIVKDVTGDRFKLFPKRD